MTLEALSMLERIGGLDLVRAATGAFLRTAPVRLGDARAGLARGDARAVANAVHALKSSCLQLGAPELGGHCEEVESLALAGRLEGVSGMLDRIERDLEAFHGELERALERIAAAPRRLVAVVEDNPDNRLLLHAILSSRFELIECVTGEEAIAELPKRVPGVILMDISLPGGDGVETLARLRQDPALATVPVVAVTAHAMSGDRERYLSAGFTEYVSKPIVDDAALLGLVARLAESGA